MGSETNSNTEAPKTPAPLSPAQEKELAIKAYFEAPTRQAKREVVAKYPVLKTVFSESNHS